MITGKYGKYIEELSRGRTEITTGTIQAAERLYMIRKRTWGDDGKPKKAEAMYHPLQNVAWSGNIGYDWCEEYYRRFCQLGDKFIDVLSNVT